MISLLFSSQAHCARSMIEYSKMLRSDTLRDVNTLGFYTIFGQDRYAQYYLGIDLALFEPETATDSHFAARVAIGISGTGKFAPYADIGTGLADILFRGNDGSQSCNEQNSCEPDFYFRAGLRIAITYHVHIGAFYEGVRFGDLQNELSGSHGYTGVNIGVRY
jgi:opacity protein-like surface antigen